jgi:hypothetical protein
MNRRAFFRLAAGVAAVPLIPKPLMAMAVEPKPFIPPLEGLYYFQTPYTTGEYLGIPRLSTPIYNGRSVLTPAVIRKFVERQRRVYA